MVIPLHLAVLGLRSEVPLGGESLGVQIFAADTWPVRKAHGRNEAVEKYPPVVSNIAIEHDHRNNQWIFPAIKWWIFPQICVKLPEGTRFFGFLWENSQ